MEGTRGKSSVVRFFHKLFYENDYNTLSRETGLVPMIYYNNEKIFVKREGEMPFNLLTEVKIIMDQFSDQETDVVIFENNAIRAEYMRSLSDYLRADVVIITTITFDHILSQGFSMEETADTFIKSIPPESHIIFWTNHEYEYKVFKERCEKLKKENMDLFLSVLEEREYFIYSALKKIIKEKGLEIKKDVFATKEQVVLPSKKIEKYTCEYIPEKELEYPIEEKCPPDETIFVSEEIASYDLKNKIFIDIGHVNDPIHTYLLLRQLMLQKNFDLFYLLFNFREDRLERIPLFIEGFLPLIINNVKGIIIRSDSIAFSPEYLVKEIKKKIDGTENLEFFTFNDFEEFINKINTQIPENNHIVMVANTADKFGYEIIDKLNLFRDSYPILDHINLFELRYSKKSDELY